MQQGSGATVQGVPLVLLFDWATGKQKHSLALGDKTDCFVHDLLLHAEDFVMAVTSGTPGRGKLVFWRPGEAKPFFETTQMPNCHSLALHADGRRLAVAATSANSNGNGRQPAKRSVPRQLVSHPSAPPGGMSQQGSALGMRRLVAAFGLLDEANSARPCSRYAKIPKR